jgi:hypothetical protein
MNKIVLYIVILFSSAFPQYGSDTIPVNLSTLLKAQKGSAKVISFDSNRSIKIVIDTSEKAAEKKDFFSAAQACGVDPNGDYFLPKSAAQKYGGGPPEVSFLPDWSRHEMVEAGSYYVFHSGVKIFGRQAYRFFVNGQQLPRSSSAAQKEDCSRLNIGQGDVANQDSGECFFYSLPLQN